jgi:hypothetical protein
LNIPLAAGLFGKKKLAASPWKVAAEADIELLLAFGAGQRVDIRHGVTPRIHRLFRSVAAKITSGNVSFDDLKPMLEFIARRYPVGWLHLADLARELKGSESIGDVKVFLRKYLEKPDGPMSAVDAWKQLADVCHGSNDPVGELHALSELAAVPGVPLERVSNAANRVNAILGSWAAVALPEEERDVLVQSLARSLETHLALLDADGCSRLAWLYIRLGEDAKAMEIATAGLGRDGDNIHCQRIADKLASSQFWQPE